MVGQQELATQQQKLQEQLVVGQQELRNEVHSVRQGEAVLELARGCDYDSVFAAHALLIAGPHAETIMKNMVHIPLSSFLRSRLKPELASRALPQFACKAKKALLRQCAKQCRRPFAVRVQNAWRPGYFREDLKMLKRVFRAKSFQTYLAALASRPKRKRAATPGVARAPRRAPGATRALQSTQEAR